MKYAKVINRVGFIYKETTHVDGNKYILPDRQILTFADERFPIKVMLEKEEKGRRYIVSDLGYIYNVEDLEEINEQQYIDEFLDSELRNLRINDAFTDKHLPEVAEELRKAFVSSVLIYSKRDWVTRYWYATTRDAVVACQPLDISVDLDDRTKEISLHVTCSRPGLFIGKGGQIVDYWTKLLNGVLNKWIISQDYTITSTCKVSIRIHEKHVIKFEGGTISL